MLGAYSFRGLDAEHIGYGAMVARFVEVLEDRVELRDDAENVVFGLMPNMIRGWFRGQRTACMTMWETDTPPPLFRRFLPQFDKVLVPSTFSRDLFAEFSNDIAVVPLGIDRTVWKPSGVPTGRFRFITAGSSWPRKGIQQVIDAFHAADVDAELIVKLPDWVAEDPGVTDGGPNVTIMRERLSVNDEVALYRSADCFVSGSRGEGFGLIPLQNVAVGNIVIAPGHTGHSDFAHLFDYNLSWRTEPSRMQKWPDTGNWFVPDFDEMVDAMRDAFERGRLHWASRQKRWRSTAGWTWEDATDVLLDKFPAGGVLAKQDFVELAPPVEVLALRNVYADIGRHRIRGSKGDVLTVPASTVQQLLDSGLVQEL